MGGGAVGCPRLAFEYGYQNKRLHMSSDQYQQENKPGDQSLLEICSIFLL